MRARIHAGQTAKHPVVPERFSRRGAIVAPAIAFPTVDDEVKAASHWGLGEGRRANADEIHGASSECGYQHETTLHIQRFIARFTHGMLYAA